MFEMQDLAVIGFLVILEGILSIDNAVVLALLARPLPPEQQKRALTYGLVGAVVFRFIALMLVTQLMQWNWVKYVGGGYLLFISIKHFMKRDSHENDLNSQKPRSFWMTVLVIELTDIAFAADSILAAVALSNKFWVIFIGGILGVITMRFAAAIFIKLLHKYPNFETSAFIMVFLVGTKLIVDALKLPGIDFHSPSSIGFWLLWLSMSGALAVGFIKKHEKN